MRRIVCVVDISGNIRCTWPERPIKAQFTSTAIRHITSIAFCNEQTVIVFLVRVLVWCYSGMVTSLTPVPYQYHFALILTVSASSLLELEGRIFSSDTSISPGDIVSGLFIIERPGLNPG
jgi:hypothetical protein